MPKTPSFDFPPIDVAALDVVCSLSAQNLAEGTTGSVVVSRPLLLALRDALEDSYPGVVDRVYLNRRRALKRAS